MRCKGKVGRLVVADLFRKWIIGKVRNRENSYDIMCKGAVASIGCWCDIVTVSMVYPLFVRI